MDQDFFKKIVYALDSLLYVTDTDGIILFVNPAFEDVTGYREEELIGNKTSLIKSGKSRIISIQRGRPYHNLCRSRRVPAEQRYGRIAP